MSANPESDRRAFLTRTASVAAGSVVAGSVAVGSSRLHVATANAENTNRLPREVSIATVSQDGMRANNPKQMANQLLARMNEAANVKPDIICLPEIFPFVNLEKSAPSVVEVAEQGIGPFLEPFAKFAADHHCYVVCPVYTKEKEYCFNAAVFLDRQGRVLGEYRKIHPTVDEIEAGVVPGPLVPPVFEADFGKIGAQICFDIEWDAGWTHLRASGAEIVFWPSAFAGGQMVNARAWQNRYCVVSSTNKDVSKICDITGQELAATSRWHPWVCSTVNLEKKFLHTWPYVRRFGDIMSKYGSSVRITTLAFEEWSIIESRDASVRIADVMREFDLLSIEEHLRKAEDAQNRKRPS